MVVGASLCLHHPFNEETSRATTSEESEDDNSHPLSRLSARWRCSLFPLLCLVLLWP